MSFDAFSSRNLTPPHIKCTDVPQFTALLSHASNFRNDDKLHLKHLLGDAFRCQGLMAVHNTSQHFEQGVYPSEGPLDSSLLLRRENSGTFGKSGSFGPGSASEHTNASASSTATQKQRNNGSNIRRRIILDYSRQHVTGETMELLFDLADRMGLTERMNEMRSGYNINFTERRAVMHHVLRMPRGYNFKAQHPKGDVILAQVHEVLDRIADFSEGVRSGRIRGCTNKKLKSIVCIGIGGNESGPEAIYEALRDDFDASQSVCGKDRNLQFLANIDPVDFELCTRDLNPEETLVIITSKSFTTAETMQNARAMRRWLVRNLCARSKIGNSDDIDDETSESDVSCEVTEEDVVKKHFCAISSSFEEVASFGISEDKYFPFWDWVGGRFSVWSAVGMLPLSIHYSYRVMRRFLDGAHDIDEHFFDAPLGGNIPVLLGLLGVWNSTFMGYHTRALLPYAHALRRFPALVQKFDMESNGKRVTACGMPLPFHAGEINFGEAGTIGQYSFYQLLHQGRTVPSDFIGFMESQSVVDEEYNEPGRITASSDGWDSDLKVSSHDELMSNFFAQPDALAHGKTLNELAQEGVPADLRQHKVIPGNRPSSSILMTKLDAFAVGQLLAIYEHRTVVQGFIWGINSFDQFGTELGKIFAERVRRQLSVSRGRGASVQGFNSSTSYLLDAYLSHGKASR